MNNIEESQFAFIKAKNRMQDNQKTLLVYDPSFDDHRSKQRRMQNPKRTMFIIKWLKQRGWFQHPSITTLQATGQNPQIEDLLLLAHDKKYLEYIKSLVIEAQNGEIQIKDTYFNKQTQKRAKYAVSGCIKAIQSILENGFRNGFAILRPPGHHSGSGTQPLSGFCIYNNVLICAKHLIKNKGMKRVAIIDWDVHFGDGTHQLLKDTNTQEQILLISIHRYDRGTFFPAGPSGSTQNSSKFRINIALNYVDQKFNEYSFQAPGDNEYIYLLHRIVLPILEQYNPNFVLISSGLDSAYGDYLGRFTLTPNGYRYMANILNQFGKPVLAVLEGGYHLRSICTSAEGVLLGMLKNTLVQNGGQGGGSIHPQGTHLDTQKVKMGCQLPQIMHEQIDHIIDVLAQHWPVLKNDGKLTLYTDRIKQNSERVFGVVSKPQTSSSSSQEQFDDLDQEVKKVKRIQRDEKRWITELNKLKKQCLNSKTK